MLSGIIGFIICAGGAALFTFFGYSLAFLIFDDTFTASVKVKPYDDLPVVQYMIENGFVDEKDENYKVVSVEDEGYIPILEFRKILKKKYHVN